MIAVIDGIHLGQKNRTNQNYLYEIISRLDKYVLPGQVELIIPNHTEKVMKLQNIKIIERKMVRFWFFRVSIPYAIKNKRLYINLFNGPSLTNNSIVCIHDLRIMHKFNGKYIDPLNYRIKNFILTFSSILFAKEIITCSQYCKCDIQKRFSLFKKKISVIYNGWEHIEKIEDNSEIFDKYPQILKGEYYFSIGTQAPHKNFVWVEKTANLFSASLFVVAGNISWDKSACVRENSNILYLGYVTESEKIALLRNCKAFLFPSLFEGFGIPPLEALALGKVAIVSNESCLPEIYQNCVHYVDPYDYNVNLDQLLRNQVNAPEQLLNIYSWELAAKAWSEVLKKYINIAD